jgi:hypothetical protein
MTEFFIDYEGKQRLINNIKTKIHLVGNNTYNVTDIKDSLKIHSCNLKIKPILNLCMIEDLSNIVIEYYNSDDDKVMNVEYLFEQTQNGDIWFTFDVLDNFKFSLISKNTLETFALGAHLNYSLDFDKSEIPYIQYYFLNSNDVLFVDYREFSNNRLSTMYNTLNNACHVDIIDLFNFVDFFMTTHYPIKRFIKNRHYLCFDYKKENDLIMITNKKTKEIFCRKILKRKTLLIFSCVSKLITEIIINTIESNMLNNYMRQSAKLINAIWRTPREDLSIDEYKNSIIQSLQNKN